MADAPPPDPRVEERVGGVLDGKWTLERLIGRGGMAAVYAARHRNGARAAVKVLHPSLGRIPEVRERFLREGYAANRVEHRGAVQVLDDDVVAEGPDKDIAYIVMELLEGESLEVRSRGKALVERELLEILDGVLDVLEAAHTRGVVHRDLKPDNLFLAIDSDQEGIRVKVLDFGLARLAESDAVTSAGLAIGTPSFMSPEQAGGRNVEIDARSDIFSLGATMFRVRTGRRIHEIDNPVRLVVAMGQVPAPKIRDVLPDVGERFAMIVDRALEFRPEDRYQSAAEMRTAVRAALDAEDGPTLGVLPFSTRMKTRSGAEEPVRIDHEPSPDEIGGPSLAPVVPMEPTGPKWPLFAAAMLVGGLVVWRCGGTTPTAASSNADGPGASMPRQDAGADPGAANEIDGGEMDPSTPPSGAASATSAAPPTNATARPHIHRTPPTKPPPPKKR